MKKCWSCDRPVAAVVGTGQRLSCSEKHKVDIVGTEPLQARLRVALGWDAGHLEQSRVGGGIGKTDSAHLNQQTLGLALKLNVVWLCIWEQGYRKPQECISGKKK